MPVNTDLANDVWSRYQWLRDNGHLDFVKKAVVCEDFFVGMQWDASDMALLRAQKRPHLTINKIISTIANVLGEQIYNRTDIAFKPRNEGASAGVADALTKVFMQIADNNQLSWTRSDVFADGVISSRGFFDVRLDFSDSLRGEVRITQLNPKNVLIDGDADEYDPDSWSDVVTTKWMSPDQIEMLYSKKDADILRGRQESSLPYGYDSIDANRDRFGSPHAQQFSNGMDPNRDNTRNIRVIERQWKKLDKMLHFVDIGTGDMRPVPTDWDEDRIAQHMAANPNLSLTKKLKHRIRWTVVADNVVLHDDWSPYKHFTVVPYFPYFRRGRTVGLVENLVGPQELLNKVSSQELHVVNTSANSGWKTKKDNIVNMSVAELEQRGAQSGLVLEVLDLEATDKIQPNQTPTGLDRISYKAEEHIKSISGVSDYMQGFAREDVSAKSVNSNKQSGQANLAKVMDNMNRSDYILARNVLDLVQEFYTEERLLVITTDKLTNQTEQLAVNQPTPEGIIANDLTVGEYAVVVTNQPERDTFEDTQFDQAIMLRKEAGVAIPDKYILLASRLKDKAEIVKAMEGDQESPEAQRKAALAARAQEAEVMTMEADASSKQADAQLKAAKTQTELQGDGGEQAKIEAEMATAERELEMEMRKMEAEFALKRDMAIKEFELKREIAMMDQELKKQETAANIVSQRQATAQQAKAQAQQPVKPGAGGKPAAKPAAKPKTGAKK